MIAIAWFALFSWPVVTVVLFRKYSLQVALCASLIGGYLLLPARLELDLPLLPGLDKHTIPALCAFAISFFFLRQKREVHVDVLPGWVPRDPVVIILFLMIIVGAFGTVLTNRDPLFFGPLVLPGAGLKDAFSLVLSTLMFLLPMLLGRRLLATPDAQKLLLQTLLISALCYVPLALWEVRMSPQLHTNLYGYFPSSFVQHMRAGGFRPVVFLNHGLELSIYLCFAIIATVALFRLSEGKRKGLTGIVVLFLLSVLVLSKSLGALILAICALPLVLFLQPRMQLLIAACVAGIVITYPMLRAAHVIPLDSITEFAESIDPTRAASLIVRLDNEEALLARAQERSLFGWGGWDRNRIFDKNGIDTSITDGTWIIELGTGGWLRFLSVFGLLCWPIIGSAVWRRREVDPALAALSIILAIKLVDLIPNSGLVPVVALVAGAMLGRLEMGKTTTEINSVGVQGVSLTDKSVLQPQRAQVYARTQPLQDDGAPEAFSDDTRYARRHTQEHVSEPSAGRVRYSRARHTRQQMFERKAFDVEDD